MGILETKLKDRVAIVTAASKGLGRASALELARDGARVVICARSAGELEATAAEIRALTGAEVQALPADMSNAGDIRRVVAETKEKFGRIDILVANAGGPPAGPFEKFSDADWMQAFELTMLSFVRLVREVLPHMKEQGQGSIVAIQSSSIKAPIPELVLSNSLRAGVYGLAKDLAIALAPNGIRVNVVAPGRIDTDRVRSLDRGRAEKAGISPEEFARQYSKNIPLGRYGQPEELGRVVAFLASGAASYVTGQALLVDGGMVKSL